MRTGLRVPGGDEPVMTGGRRYNDNLELITLDRTALGGVITGLLLSSFHISATVGTFYVAVMVN